MTEYFPILSIGGTRLLAALASPLPLVVLGSLLALLLAAYGRRRAAVLLGALSLVTLWLFSTPWVAWHLADNLERRYPPVAAQATVRADAIIVLGGALAAADPPARPHINLGSAADRVWFAGDLYRAGKARWVLLSGGNQPGFEQFPAESEAMREMLRVMQVPDSAMRLERRSRNTLENAHYSLEMARSVEARKVLLVTSALHMPRALATFEAAFKGSGIELMPASTDAEALGGELDPVLQWLPDAGSLAWSARAIKEYLGLARLRVKEGWFWH